MKEERVDALINCLFTIAETLNAVVDRLDNLADRHECLIKQNHEVFTKMREEFFRKVIEIESKAIGELSERIDVSFEKAVELILRCQGRVVVTGMGKTGIIGRKIAATLSSIFHLSFFHHSR